MRMAFGGGVLKGIVSSPPSKSHTHRAFFLSAMADGESKVSNCLLSDDTLSTLKATEAMGALVKREGNTVLISGGDLYAPAGTVDAGNSGTTMRIFSGIASMFDEWVTIDGDSSLRKRPMGPLLDALSRMGVETRSDGGRPPVEIKGSNEGGKVSIDGSISSQFITSLLITSPMLANDTEITIEGKMVSEPYINVTTHIMRLFGADVQRSGNAFRVKGRTGYSPYDYVVPADFSSAAFPLVAGALGGEVTVKGLQMDDPQGDRVIIDILRTVGASVSVGKDFVTVKKGSLRAADIDMGGFPDLFPILAVLLSTADGTSRLYGAPQLKFKESDRIKTTVEMLTAIGADAEGTDDGCVIRGKKRLTGGTVNNEGDHRIMMAAAVASLLCEDAVVMDGAECCSVSYPEFPEHMRSLGMKVEVL
ncbi:MAG: 3-phosphoshikimate 1-carboxyvinyltransferase [Candidatus Methanoplasma sp.]|jgi:3-phosphoshikimate 1-carboxyvinyltransferase|nr:3-phosphoshikimate 1-carboxyvinyltransferase [Candidatus Methanoplasma sp.]